MKRSLTIATLVAALVAAPIAPTSAETVTSLSLGGGYQENLFNDSASIGDSYTSLGGDVQLFPSARTQLTLGGAYNMYHSTDGLSNLNAGASFAVIPTGPASPVSLSLRASGSIRDFGLQYDLYDQSTVAATAGIGIRPLTSVMLYARAGAGATDYRNSLYGSNKALDAAAGFNLALPGSNSLAVDFEYSHRLWDLPALTSGSSSGNSASSSVDQQPFDLAGVSARLSRPFGQRTGLNIAARYHKVYLDQAATIPGYSIDYLSPWGDLWTGQGFSIGLKHFLPSQFILDCSGAYSDKSFVPTIESDSADLESAYLAPSREDTWLSLGTQLSRPITLAGGRLLTPTVSVGYVTNESNHAEYDYTNLSATLSLGLRF